MLAQLYSQFLVAEKNVESPKKSKPSSQPTAPKPLAKEKTIKFLGNNAKQVLIIVNYKDAVHLPDEQLDFLTQLLKACKLSLDDVAIANIYHYSDSEKTAIVQQLNSTFVILFDAAAEDFGFPFKLPDYQVQKFSDLTVLQAPALHLLQHDKTAKTKLWGSLKKMFNL